MKKKLRTMKSTMIMGILLVSVFAAMVPVSSAQSGLFSFAHVLDIEWLDVQNATRVIMPFEEQRVFNIQVTHSLNKGPLGNLLYRFFYVGRLVNIKLSIESYPSEWCTVSTLRDTIQFSLKPDPLEQQVATHQILISVSDNAPAYRQGVIKIRITEPAARYNTKTLLSLSYTDS